MTICRGWSQRCSIGSTIDENPVRLPANVAVSHIMPDDLNRQSYSTVNGNVIQGGKTMTGRDRKRPILPWRNLLFRGLIYMA